jgi:hypothetical protein
MPRRMLGPRTLYRRHMLPRLLLQKHTCHALNMGAKARLLRIWSASMDDSVAIVVMLWRWAWCARASRREAVLHKVHKVPFHRHTSHDTPP